MRNLKRALSLTLASVMLLGMMVVGSSAAGYPDVSEEENIEAIEVLQSVGVMEGDNNGNFNPDDYVTREQMAVIMSKLLNLDYNYYQGTNPFSDVPAWAAPYVAACAANGITSGIGGGMYGAGQNVNAVQAALMMLKALGYFQYQADFGEDYVLATVKQATEVGLFAMIDSKAEQALTRNEVAQMALNALKSEMVTFTGDPGVEYTGTNGESWIGGYKSEYTARTSTQAKYQAIERRTSDVAGGNNLNRGQYYIQLGEELYDGDLRLSDNELDVFGRPSRIWSYKGAEIGTYAKKELLVSSYTAGVKGSEVYNKLSQATIRDYDINAYVDGAWNVGSADGQIEKNDLVRSNNSSLADTARGVLTELYRDDDNKDFYIVSINTWLAQATVDYNESSETITLVVYDAGNGGSITKRVDVEDAPYIAGMKKDDWCLVQWADDTDPHTAKTVVDAFQVEIREDQEVTGFNRGQSEDSSIDTGRHDRVTKITVDGTNYDNNTNAWYKHNTLNDFDANELVNKTYTVYMDQFGYFIGVELYSGDNQYVFITGYDRTQSNITVSTSKAAAIFTDGTMQAIDVNVKDTDKNISDWLSDHTGDPLAQGYDLWSSHIANNGEHQENMWYKYTENKGVYTLTPVDGYTRDINDDPADRTVNCSNIYLTHNITNDYGTGRSYGEDESIYIVVDEDAVDPGKGITEVTGLYTGVQNVNLVVPHNKWIHAVWEDNYIVAAIVFGDAEGIVDNYAFIRSGVNREWKETDANGDVTHFWEFDAVMDGVKTTKTVKTRFANTTRQLKPGTVQELVLDSDGYVTKIKDLENTPNTPAATHVSGNEIYDNVDFNSTAVTSLKDYDAYHIMTRFADRNYSSLYDHVSNTDTLTGLNPGTTNINLAFQNNTLRYTTRNNDIGLPVTKDAKAVVWQSINGKSTWTDYSSVAAAYAMLNDADGDSTTNVNGAKQFDGEVIAALNSNGVAEWVVFIDYTPTQGKNPSYPGGSVTGNYVTDIEINGAFLNIERTNVVAPATSVSMVQSQAEIINWLASNGYTVLNAATVGTEVPAAGAHVGATITALDANGRYVTLIPRYTDLYTIKVDGAVKDTVAYNGTSTKVTSMSGKGQGCLVGTTYTPYARFSTPTSVTAPVVIETGYVTVDIAGVATVTQTGFNGNSAFTADEGTGWPTSPANYAKVGSTVNVKLTWTADPAAVKGAVVTISGAATGVYKLTADQLKAAETTGIQIPAIVGDNNIAASGITVTVTDGAAGTLPTKEPESLNPGKLGTSAEEFAMAVATDAAAGSGVNTEKMKWAKKVITNLKALGDNAYTMDSTLMNAMNHCGNASLAGAAEGDIAFMFSLDTTGNNYYVLAIYDSNGAFVAAEQAGAFAYNAGTTTKGLIYIRPTALNSSMDAIATGVTSLSGTYTYVIYNAGTSNPSVAGNSWTATGTVVKTDTFTVR